MRRAAMLAILAASLLVVAGGFAGGTSSTPIGARAADQAKTVYVYDSNSSANGFDHSCKGWVWSELGFLDGNGKPADDGSKKGDQIKVGGDVKGMVLSDSNGKANGYGSADGTKEAYDLARGATLKQAYQRLKSGDKLVICKHGGQHSHVKAGGETESHHGGVLHLDGGELFTGFKVDGTKSQGTNVNQKGQRPAGQPYALPAATFDKGTVTATLYGCWTSKAEGKGEKSVADSLEDVLGKGTVEGFDGVIKSAVAYTINIEGAASDEEAKTLEELAKKRLSEAATKAGFEDDPGGWLTNVPFEDQYKTANAVMDKDPKLKGKATVTFEYPTPTQTFFVSQGSECPEFVLGGRALLSYGEQEPMTLQLAAGSFGHNSMDIVLLQPDATQLPDGPGVLDSPVLEVASALDQNPELTSKLMRPARLTLPYFTMDSSPELYSLYKGSWIPVGAKIRIDHAKMRLSASIRRLGTFALFAPAQPPSSTVTISEDDTWTHNQALGESNICINVRTSPAQAFATVTLDGPNGYHSASPPQTPLINGARQFVSLINEAGDYTKTITVYDITGAETGGVTTTFTVKLPPTNGPPATPACAAPTG